MSENMPLTSTPSLKEGSYSPPSCTHLFEHAQAAERAGNLSEHAEHWPHDGDVKVTVSEHLGSHTASDDDFPRNSSNLKPEPQEERAEARKSAAHVVSQQSVDYPAAGGDWNEFDTSPAIFNFQERPVRDAGWLLVVAVALVVLVGAAAFAFDPSIRLGDALAFLLVYSFAFILLFALSLPLTLFLVSYLCKISAHTLKTLMTLAAVIFVLQSVNSAVNLLASQHADEGGPSLQAYASSNRVLPALLLLSCLFLGQVLSAILTYSTAAVYARLYITSSTNSGSSSSEVGQAGGGEERMTARGQLQLFCSALSLACTSSLGTCCAVAFTASALGIAEMCLSALVLALFGQGIIGSLPVALLHCTNLAILFFLHCLVLPTSAMSGHGFTRSLRLSLDILQRYALPIVASNAAGFALPPILIGGLGMIALIVAFFVGPGLVTPLVIGFFFLILAAPALLAAVGISSVLVTGVATTVLCFAWDKRLESEEGSDAAGLVGAGSPPSAHVKDVTAV
ncbi:unnamed protein product [Closterium sp. Naga37s-1]|nr:unnamed protein product [Closterium sp. Naga37s-1]